MEKGGGGGGREGERGANFQILLKHVVKIKWEDDIPL